MIPRGLGTRHVRLAMNAKKHSQAIGRGHYQLKNYAGGDRMGT